MPRIEMSLSPDDHRAVDTCDLWAVPVRESADACLLLDERGHIVATSGPCRSALGFRADVDSRSIPLLESSLRLLTFTASAGALPKLDAQLIPPLQALNTGALSRGLIRVSVGDVARTFDVIASPLHGETSIAGSLSFLRHC